MHNPVPHYRRDIDGLRAIAVIAVIINHFDKDILPGGYLGVDMFFVISGFVITSSFVSRQHKNIGDFLADFYLRRIQRLLPALVLFTVVSSLLIYLFNPYPVQSLKTGIAALLCSSNFYLIRQSMDYFAESTELNIFTHTWSLGVEEQFYFFFPLLFWITGFSRGVARGSVNILSVVGLLSISSLAVFIYLYPLSTVTAYFLMHTRFWELGAGCLLCIGLMPSGSFLHRVGNIPSLLILAGILGVFFLPILFAVPATIAVVMLTVMLIAGMRTGTIAYKFFTYPKLIYIGLISYSLYLWHWGVLAISHWTIGIHWWTVPFQLVLILLVSMASYHYVEIPLRHAVWSVHRWKSIAFGLGALLAAIVLLVVLVIHAGQLHDQNQFDWAPSNCRFDGNNRLHIERCVSPRSSKKRFYLLGDSHAGMFNGAATSLLSREFDIVAITGSYCIFPSVYYPSQKYSVLCAVDQRRLAEWIRNDVQAGDIVFIGNALLSIFNDKKMDKSSRDIIYANYIHELERFAATVSGKGARIGLYIDPALFQDMQGNQCAGKWTKLVNKKVCQVEKAWLWKQRAFLVNQANHAIINGARFEIWDGMINGICNDTYCDSAGYADSNHLQPEMANRILTEIIKNHQIMNQAIQKP